MTRSTRFLCVAAALTLSASPAAAQFTGVVAPPKPRPAAPAAAATPGARSDSAGRTALTDMRAWVDSAAGITAPAAAARADSIQRQNAAADTTADSVVVRAEAAGRVDAPPAASADADGMRAPDTATMMPAIVLAGLLMLGAGAFLLRRARA